MSSKRILPPANAKRVPKFLRQLYRILTDEDASIITWAPDGASIKLYNIRRLEAEVLPKYFKHNKLASFQRQLNYFGFRKWTKTQSSVCTFSHPQFTREAVTPSMPMFREIMPEDWTSSMVDPLSDAESNQTENDTVLSTTDWNICLELLASPTIPNWIHPDELNNLLEKEHKELLWNDDAMTPLH
ncbi:hypothetical protein ACHHYP_05271 [Achlya hypogyna]|uniref:HSF-type DNA-binding domain-containing protein n=1 Tax=Achlya hypogyna TaxID=1202772 RepID=A0A1V9YYH9_ACHHY|nr:hypothetical protein ACHHYP_05271 [Achlya hypogyna]